MSFLAALEGGLVLPLVGMAFIPAAIRLHFSGRWECSPDVEAVGSRNSFSPSSQFIALAIHGMNTSAHLLQGRSYLDANELADILGLSLRTITLRAKHRPWLLPPRAVLSDRELLRWRQDVAVRWILENLTSTN
ncbi:hypothetical protein AYM40_15880 [Paraburkholderia phytofirmans OLGA172]|uniref:Helix-turn-helix domain-containing protein n=2 Tax=Paraburkholderia phytofirmans TaxID=261302 RepID=A0A160FMC4_9BURK|nr:hypothetical protein AYM40_15880 [Paraburkholderia phytofirmans OLGA172]